MKIAQTISKLQNCAFATRVSFCFCFASSLFAFVSKLEVRTQNKEPKSATLRSSQIVGCDDKSLSLSRSCSFCRRKQESTKRKSKLELKSRRICSPNSNQKLAEQNKTTFQQLLFVCLANLWSINKQNLRFCLILSASKRGEEEESFACRQTRKSKVRKIVALAKLACVWGEQICYDDLFNEIVGRKMFACLPKVEIHFLSNFACFAEGLEFARLFIVCFACVSVLVVVTASRGIGECSFCALLVRSSAIHQFWLLQQTNAFLSCWQFLAYLQLRVATASCAEAGAVSELLRVLNCELATAIFELGTSNFELRTCNFEGLISKLNFFALPENSSPVLLFSEALIETWLRKVSQISSEKINLAALLPEIDAPSNQNTFSWVCFVDYSKTRAANACQSKFSSRNTWNFDGFICELIRTRIANRKFRGFKT